MYHCFMGTTKVGDKVKRLNISLHPEVLRMLDETAKELGMSRSGVITLAMQSVKAFKTPEMSKALEKVLRQFMKGAKGIRST